MAFRNYLTFTVMASASIAVIRFEALKEITKRGLFLFRKVVDLASTQIFLDGLTL
jgi:hypothetical protein